MALPTYPPHLFPASRRYHFRRQVAVESGMPLCGDLRLYRAKVVKTCQHPPSRTVGTAAAVNRTAGNHRLIGMSIIANPPGFAVAVRRYCPGRQCAVKPGSPLRGDLRKQVLKIVFPGYDYFSRAHGTACSVSRPGQDCCLPFVPFFTLPPDFPVGARGNIPWRQRVVLLRVPLFCKFRICGQQVIFAFGNGPVGTDRTTAAGHPGLYNGLPGMSVFTYPPHQPVTAGEKLVWGKRRVFRRMPLLYKLGVLRRQVGLVWNWKLPGAVGTPCPRAGSGMYRAAPFMSLLTPPPDPAAAAAGNGVRSQLSVFFAVPLPEQFSPVCSYAKLFQRFSDSISPSQQLLCLVSGKGHMLTFLDRIGLLSLICHRTSK